jgi:hypothetical protein
LNAAPAHQIKRGLGRFDQFGTGQRRRGIEPKAGQILVRLIKMIDISRKGFVIFMTRLSNPAATTTVSLRMSFSDTRSSTWFVQAILNSIGDDHRLADSFKIFAELLL